MIVLRKAALIAAVLLSLSAARFVLAREGASPIADPGRPDDLVPYTGQPASPQQIEAEAIPQHPFMQRNEQSNIHNDAYMSDTYTQPGPLGIDPQVTSVDLGGICATITFDSHGRIITSCLNLNTANLYVLNATTLEILDSLALPFRKIDIREGIEFPAGSYFYLDAEERIIIPVVGNEVWRMVVSEEGKLITDHIYDLNKIIPDGDEINSILPDFDGLLWFTTHGGMVGTLNAVTENIAVLQFEGEQIDNSFAVDETGGVFIVTNTALYRLDASESAEPTITWREGYDRGSEIKPGQASQGSGTTPTLMGADYVAITDNAEPQMHVLVYRRGAENRDERLVCAVPVFTEGRSATENSLIATDHSLIVENNYGYAPLNIIAGPSEPGLTRIDVDDSGNCDVIWTASERIPTAVTKLSLATGLVYTYTRNDGGFARGQWWFTAVDFTTGETVWKQYVGTGANFNNNYAAVYLGNHGSAYVGVTSGIVMIRDSD